MACLPVRQNRSAEESGGGCGTSCGAGLEKIYPTVAVRYGAMRWIGEFEVRSGAIFKCGAKMIVKTDRGIELGEQVSLTCNGCSKSVSREQIKKYVENSGPEFFKFSAGRVMREASPDDISENEHLNRHNREDIDRAQLLAAQLDLDLKIVTCEHLFGGERIVFYFRSEARIDFRELVRELARHYQTRIEMRQVRPRDEARLVADYEVCGRECCCKNFLKELRPVNMKMAKLQKSTLDPSKVSGRCGRLRCCLRYEHEGYEELARKLPNVSSWVDSEFGVAQVLDRQILTQLVLVRTGEGRQVTIPVEELKAMNVAPPRMPAPGPEADAPPRPARPPRPDHPRSAPVRPPPPEPVGRSAFEANETVIPADPVPSQPVAPSTPEDFDDGPDIDTDMNGAGADGAAEHAPTDGQTDDRPRRRRRRRRGGRQRPEGGPPGTPPGPPA